MTTEFDASGAAITSLQLYCTENNEAVAVWAEGGSTYLTARFTAGQGWDDTETLSTNGTAGQITFNMHRGGWGAAVYQLSPGSGLRYLDADGTWQAEVTPSGALYGLSAGANGDLFAAYSVYNPATGSGQYIASRYEPGAGWASESVGGGVAVGTYGTTGTADGGAMYLSYAGNVLVWQYDGMAWSESEVIDGPQGSTQSIDMTAAPDGEAYLAWVVQPALGTRNLMGVFRDPNT